ncbi:sensor histidine kinase [Pedobacter sp. PLR]|uniref:sensor histidine kinase n=1 Tax=Pedobacter sp. PLR TaxID=2994465 RepID=UPI00224740C0|nr:sensor histidine kinase [Pedobacter sp. PLR]MCX2452848.1 sensor histidine kinase [Pedobacter sp. PLR]
MSNFIIWFHSFYQRTNRVTLHLAMWLAFGIFIELGLILSHKVSFYSSLFFLLHRIALNVVLFYLFFYWILPQFILKRKILASVLLSIGLIYISEIIQYLGMIFTYHYGEVDNPIMKIQFEKMAEQGFFHIFSFKNIMGDLIFIIASLSPFFCIKILVDIMKLAYKRTQLEKEKALMEINFLKSQLNPHFLFNTLNSLYILNMKKDKAASDLILELSETLRYTLYESNTEQVSLDRELDFLENYVKLESVRYPAHTRIEFDCDRSAAGVLNISPLLTFPFIENAFKHGLGTSLKDAWIEITARVVGHTFHFNIRNSKNDENNGTQLKEYVGGIGVSNTKKRLALLYPGKHILEIVNTSDEYSIELMINLKS